jgi:hypothetical protein
MEPGKRGRGVMGAHVDDDIVGRIMLAYSNKRSAIIWRATNSSFALNNE